MNHKLKIVQALKGVKGFFKNLSKFRARKDLKNRTFSIISNNCTAGYIYQHFGIEYKSPTAGLFFHADDYLKICREPHRYFSKEPSIISKVESKRYDVMEITNRWGDYPIGKVEDIEIYFMHYPNPNEAILKWKNRCKRMNYDNLVFLFTESETSTEEHIREFCSLPIDNKICLTYNKYDLNAKPSIKIDEVGE